MLHTMSVKEIVSQAVLLVVFSSLFTFFNIDTKFKQKIIHSIGIKNIPTKKDALTTLVSTSKAIFPLK